MNLVGKMQPMREQLSDPSGELNVNTMCANGLLRIQDILRPRDMISGGPGHLGHPGLHHHNHHHHHQLSHHPGLPNFAAINMKSSPISPPQSPPATPPMHSPDSMKGSHGNSRSSRERNESKESSDEKGNLKIFICNFEKHLSLLVRSKENNFVAFRIILLINWL